MVEYQDGKHLWLILSWVWILPWLANLLYSVNLIKNKYTKVYKWKVVFKQRHFSVSYKVTTTLGWCRGCELRLGSELIKEQDSCRSLSCRSLHPETPGSEHTPPSPLQSPPQGLGQAHPTSSSHQTQAGRAETCPASEVWQHSVMWQTQTETPTTRVQTVTSAQEVKI